MGSLELMGEWKDRKLISYTSKTPVTHSYTSVIMEVERCWEVQSWHTLCFWNQFECEDGWMSNPHQPTPCTKLVEILDGDVTTSDIKLTCLGGAEVEHFDHLWGYFSHNYILGRLFGFRPCHAEAQSNRWSKGVDQGLWSHRGLWAEGIIFIRWKVAHSVSKECWIIIYG